jgi:hypothetical protein
MVVLYTSCKKVENTNSISSTSLNNRANTLCLEEKGGMSNAINETRTMSDEQLEAWEQKKGFVSLRHYQTELLKKIEAKQEFTQEEWDALSNEYADIAYFDEVGKLKRKIMDPSIATLVNRKGELFIGNALIYFDENKVISILDGNKEKLQEAKNGSVANNDKIYVSKLETTSMPTRFRTGTLPSSDGSLPYYTWTIHDHLPQVEGENQKYKGTSEVRISSFYLNTDGNLQLISNMFYYVYTLHRPRLAFGSWWNYNTTHRLFYECYVDALATGVRLHTFKSGEPYPSVTSRFEWLQNIGHFEEPADKPRPYLITCHVTGESDTDLGLLKFAH